jgi:hypothetical protein
MPPRANTPARRDDGVPATPHSAAQVPEPETAAEAVPPQAEVPPPVRQALGRWFGQHRVLLLRHR